MDGPLKPIKFLQGKTVQTGYDAKRVKIDEDWEKAVEKALRKKRPEEGWPKPEEPDSPSDEPPKQSD